MSGNPLRISFHTAKTLRLGEIRRLKYGVIYCSLCEYYVASNPALEEYTFPNFTHPSTWHMVGELNTAAREHLFHQHGIYRLDHRDEESSTYSVAAFMEEADAILSAITADWKKATNQ